MSKLACIGHLSSARSLKSDRCNHKPLGEVTMSKFRRVSSHAALLISTLLLSTAALADRLDDVALEAFLDGVVNTSMEENHIAGAVVGVMVDNKVVVKKGYGYSDVANKIEVDPNKTLFRIGSVTKLFTYLSLMQLHEQGKLDLEADIQDYLPNLEIPKTYDEPIRVKNIFTHTAGFEDRIIGLFGDSEASLKPYDQLLAEQMPARVREPGIVSSYSNHSLGIAGLIIENVSGLSWAEYVQQNILDPLGMEFATAYQPVPEAISENSAKGYVWQNGEYVEKPFEYVPLGAAGTMSASADAMMTFLSMQLNGGAVDGNRVIGADTLAQMQSPLYSVHPQLNNWMYGYADSNSHGVEAFGHDGATLRFFTLFMMIPGTDTGVFVSTNTSGGGKVLKAVMQGLLDRYQPMEFEIVPTESPSDLATIVGTYVTFRHAYSTAGKLNLVNVAIEITPGDDAGEILLNYGVDGPKTAIEIEPKLFQIVDTDTKVFFDSDKHGLQRMFIGGASGSFYKVSGFDNPNSQLPVLIIALLLMLWALIRWPIQRLKSTRQPSAAEHRARVSYWWFALLGIVTVLGVLTNANEQIVFGMPDALRTFLNLSYFVLLLGFFVVVNTVRLLPDVGTETSIKVMHVIRGIFAAMFCWMLYYWNLVGS